jgi:hypothetical protein
MVTHGWLEAKLLGDFPKTNVKAFEECQQAQLIGYYSSVASLTIRGAFWLSSR